MTTALGAEAARGYLIGVIERELYRSFYTQGSPVPITGSAEPSPPDLGLVEAMSSANSGVGGWDPGWRVAEIEPLQVAKNGLRVHVPQPDCIRGDTARSVGAKVSVRRPKELRASAPGFYMAVGDADPLTLRDDLEVRVYFHITADGAVPLTALCTRLLNKAKIPFRLKLLDDPGAYVRCDAAVLYLRDGSFPDVRRALRFIASACAVHLRDTAPAFAAPLVPGLAVGEHRGRLGTSFGAVRCRLLAEGIVAASEIGARRLETEIDAVTSCFAATGLDIDTPYRAPCSTARYEL